MNWVVLKYGIVVAINSIGRKGYAQVPEGIRKIDATLLFPSTDDYGDLNRLEAVLLLISRIIKKRVI